MSRNKLLLLHQKIPVTGGWRKKFRLRNRSAVQDKILRLEEMRVFRSRSDHGY